MIYERQLALAILNMLTNAEQALEGCLDGDGAQESITRRINFNARSSAGNILIKIADNDPGIPPDCLERIFDLFYSTRGSQEGTGLGLSDCRRIVELHEGQIWAQSQLGEGTTICVQIPVLRPESPE